MKLAPRSYLFVPGNRPERFDKALASGADAVIVDLEDAVAPGAKDKARDALANWLSAEHPVVVRINAAGTKWFEDDLAACVHPGVAAVMLPKAERSAELEHVARAGTVPGGRGIGQSASMVLLPLIESAAGFTNALALAQVEQVERLGFGTIDFQLDLGMDGGDEELLWFRSQLVLASRLAQKCAPIDGVTPTIDDAAAIAQDVARARRIGMGAKLCIHPRQVPVVNRGFAPSAEQLAWARRTVAAALDSDGAAVAVDGAMVDRPVLLRAQAFLREAEARGSEPVRQQLASFWNQRYQASEYAYGTEPNDFLVAQAGSFPPAARILCLADGEGRNSVWLARQGHLVSSLDIAERGRDKALKLAREAGVAIDAQVGDVTAFDPGKECWDAIVAIFLHLPPGPRRALHERCALALRPGGVFVYEAYAGGQLGRGTGGPREAALLPELEELLGDWPGCTIVERFSGERMIREGALHQGVGVVNQIVARRNP